ncbi:MAG: hypothetical protein J7641_10730 [Cyanobacteria bacterium SID2]|nr:hypothetical protein [Cyanobacteria bacterium SID2]MBP0002457.1 hypothetical protein [Cyanobacteria bacterium SBC]
MNMARAPECPRCGRHTIVQQSESRWTCLNCNFSKDLSKPRSEESESSGFFTAVLLAGVLVAVMVEVAQGAPVSDRSVSIDPWTTPALTIGQISVSIDR